VCLFAASSLHLFHRSRGILLFRYSCSSRFPVVGLGGRYFYFLDKMLVLLEGGIELKEERIMARIELKGIRSSFRK
jgi:hypothetical protein